MPSWPSSCLQLCTASAVLLQPVKPPQPPLPFIGGLLAFPAWILAWMDIGMCAYRRTFICEYIYPQRPSAVSNLHQYPIICTAPEAGLGIILTHIKLLSPFR